MVGNMNPRMTVKAHPTIFTNETILGMTIAIPVIEKNMPNFMNPYTLAYVY